jgi:hypothetical protein
MTLRMTVKFVGGEGRGKRDHVCVVQYDAHAEAHEKLLDRYLQGQGAKPGTTEFFSWRANPRNMALAIVRTVIPWFHDFDWEIISPTAVPPKEPDTVRELFTLWYLKCEDWPKS